MSKERWLEIEAACLDWRPAMGRPASVPALVWGSLVGPGSDRTVLSKPGPHHRRLSELVRAPSSHERLSVLSHVSRRFDIRPAFIVQLESFEGNRSIIDHQVLRTGRFPDIARICMSHDRRSHVNVFLDFLTFFVCGANSFAEVTDRFCLAFESYERIVTRHERLLSAEGALAALDGVISGSIESRFQATVAQHQWVLVKRQRATRLRRTVSAATILPNERALYRLRFFEAVGIRFTPVSPSTPLPSGALCPADLPRLESIDLKQRPEPR